MFHLTQLIRASVEEGGRPNAMQIGKREEVEIST
jgi:hypothetical protein